MYLSLHIGVAFLRPPKLARCGSKVFSKLRRNNNTGNVNFFFDKIANNKFCFVLKLINYKLCGVQKYLCKCGCVVWLNAKKNYKKFEIKKPKF